MALPDPAEGGRAGRLTEAVLGVTTPIRRSWAPATRHILTSAVLAMLDGGPDLRDLLTAAALRRYHWGTAVRNHRRSRRRARPVRGPAVEGPRSGAPARPLLSVEVHHWVRSVSRVLRG